MSFLVLYQIDSLTLIILQLENKLCLRLTLLCRFLDLLNRFEKRKLLVLRKRKIQNRYTSKFLSLSIQSVLFICVATPTAITSAGSGRLSGASHFACSLSLSKGAKVCSPEVTRSLLQGVRFSRALEPPLTVQSEGTIYL